jgi:hypothetical protein
VDVGIDSIEVAASEVVVVEEGPILVLETTEIISRASATLLSNQIVQPKAWVGEESAL